MLRIVAAFAHKIAHLLIPMGALFVFCTACKPKANTKINIAGGRWVLNEQPSNPGTPTEGLLMNVRMVNATFEDVLRPDIDFNRITSDFLQMLPEYRSYGINAITLNLQGGLPGYEGAVNSAYDPDGSLRYGYLNRVARVIRACDVQGVAVILGCFYQRQDQFLSDSAAVRKAVMNTAKWIQEQGFGNVALEIANEHPHKGFDHELIRNPTQLAKLIRAVKSEYPRLLISASGIGDGRIAEPVAEAADFLLIHFNETPTEQIQAKIQALKKYGKPIVCNEDDKTGQKGAAALYISIKNGCSWGYMNQEINQHFPFQFLGAQDDTAVYQAFARASSARQP